MEPLHGIISEVPGDYGIRQYKAPGKLMKLITETKGLVYKYINKHAISDPQTSIFIKSRPGPQIWVIMH